MTSSDTTIEYKMSSFLCLHTDIKFVANCDYQMCNAWVIIGIVFKQQSFYTFTPFDLLNCAM